jgi:hypothetical protein
MVLHMHETLLDAIEAQESHFEEVVLSECNTKCNT